MTTTSCCNGAYLRGGAGVWRYGWGEPVPGASDLTLLDVLRARDPDRYPLARPAPPATAEDLAWACSLCDVEEPAEVHLADGSRDLVVGLRAPELEVALMMTVAEIAEEAEVSKATVDSYRYRGYLPEPQVVRGRVPLWARPIIQHWRDNRPGSGWRTDIYGDRASFQPQRSMPISSARGDRPRRSPSATSPIEEARSALGSAG